MNSISRTIVSILLAFCIVAGAIILAIKTDKIPSFDKFAALPRTETPNTIRASDQPNIEDNHINNPVPALSTPPTNRVFSNHARVDINESVTDTSEPVAAGSVTKCLEGGKVTYSNTGCKDGATQKRVAMNYAAGVVSPPRELIDTKVNQMFAEREAENRRLAQTQQRQETTSITGPSKAESCAALNERINWLDAMARENSTDWIRDERYKARNRQFELHC